MPRHSDFQKIYDAFMWRYCEDHKECDTGKSNYYAWLNKLGVDDTEPYRYPQETREKFSWIAPHLEFIKEDDQAKYYKVEALFPLSSMNRNVYTRDELMKACRSLVGKPTNLNHTSQVFPEVQIVDADYEDDTVECLDRIEKNSKALEMIEKGDIFQVSIEAECLRGTEPTPEGSMCKGLLFTGKAYLTKDVLPGVPLTRIMPVEKLVENFTVTSVTNLSEEGKQDPTQTQEYEKALEETPWNFDASKYDIDQLRMACAVVTGPSGTDSKYVKEDCHLPHHLPGDGKTHGGTLVWRGVAAAGTVLVGGRGGVKLSQDDETKAKTHLATHYKEFDKIPPWENEVCLKIKDLETQLTAIKTSEQMFKCPKCGCVGSYYDWQANNWQCRNPHCNIDVKPPEPEVLSPRELAEKKGSCKCVLTKEGFWARFHQLRSEGASKSEAFRMVSLEVLEVSKRKSQ